MSLFTDIQCDNGTKETFCGYRCVRTCITKSSFVNPSFDSSTRIHFNRVGSRTRGVLSNPLSLMSDVGGRFGSSNLLAHGICLTYVVSRVSTRYDNQHGTLYFGHCPGIESFAFTFRIDPLKKNLIVVSTRVSLSKREGERERISSQSSTLCSRKLDRKFFRRPPKTVKHSFLRFSTNFVKSLRE